MLEEVWKPVVGYEGVYEVSDLGDVRRLPSQRILRPALLKRTGRYVVNLCRDGRSRTILLSTVVAAAFLGPRPQGHIIRHLDGNSSNDALWNLSYQPRSYTHEQEAA